MSKNLNDFHTAYNFIINHKMCKCVPSGLVHETNYSNRCLHIDVVKINPKTLEIDDNELLNTETSVWLEFGRAFIDTDTSLYVQFEHDTRLDCGAGTFEEAIVTLAHLIAKYYHDNGEAKKGAEYSDLKIKFTQSIAKDNKNLLLTVTEIDDKYDQYIDRITTVVDMSTGKTLCNDIEFDHDWELLIEG